MRYTLEYILKCIQMYRQGVWPETPEGIKNPQDFQSKKLHVMQELIRLRFEIEYLKTESEVIKKYPQIKFTFTDIQNRI